MRRIYLLFSIILLASCTDSKNELDTEAHILDNKAEEILPDSVLFTSIIPEHETDSIKIERIQEIVDRIDADSMEVRICKDSAASIWGFYQNDTLVKMVTGVPFSFGTAGSTFYFLKNQLIFRKDICRSNRVSAMCDPTVVTKSAYFYKRRILHQESEATRKNGPGCGCNLPVYTVKSFDATMVFQAIEQLKAKLENDSVPQH